MIVLYDLNSGGVGSFGGGHEAGTPQTTTGARTPGTRSNGGETDDAVSGGPSWDQIFLKKVPQLQTPGVGYVNAICDARVDSQETSTQCLSYDYSDALDARRAGRQRRQRDGKHPAAADPEPAVAVHQAVHELQPAGAAAAPTRRGCSRRARACSTARARQLGRLKTLAPGSEAPEDRHPRRRDPEDRGRADDADQQRRHHAADVHAAGRCRRRRCVGKNSKLNGDYRPSAAARRRPPSTTAASTSRSARRTWGSSRPPSSAI